MNAAAEIGVIGGSGLYALLDDAEELEVSTPYGVPSDPITVARVGDRRVAFLPRHGRDHRFPPSRPGGRDHLGSQPAAERSRHRRNRGPTALGMIWRGTPRQIAEKV